MSFLTHTHTQRATKMFLHSCISVLTACVRRTREDNVFTSFVRLWSQVPFERGAPHSLVPGPFQGRVRVAGGTSVSGPRSVPRGGREEGREGYPGQDQYMGTPPSTHLPSALLRPGHGSDITPLVILFF